MKQIVTMMFLGLALIGVGRSLRVHPHVGQQVADEGGDDGGDDSDGDED